MQCPRCFFENPADARWCGYCGHAFERDAPDGEGAGEGSGGAQGTGRGQPAADPDGPGRAARKHQTRLGLAPVDDPFAAVAQSLRGGAAADSDEPAPSSQARPPRAEPGPRSAPPPPPVPRRRARHATVVEGLDDQDEPVERAEIVGVLLRIDSGGQAVPYVLRAGSLRIGREADNDLVLDDPRVSGHHAMLRAEPGRAFVLDTSTNGTVVNGERIRADRAPLADGAVIELGRTVLAVQLFAEDTLGILRGVLP